jgi:probable metal-binding protein
MSYIPPTGMSVDAVIDFLESRGKFVARDVGFNTAKDKICNH